jgi:hypothetical protein
MRLFKYKICPKCGGSGRGTATADGYQCHVCYRKGFIKVYEPYPSYWIREKLSFWGFMLLMVAVIIDEVMGRGTSFPICSALVVILALPYLLLRMFSWNEKKTAKTLIDFAYQMNAISAIQKENLIELSKQDSKKVIGMFADF